MHSAFSINWIGAYNRLFILLDKGGTPTYYSGPSFLGMVQQVGFCCISFEMRG